MGLLYTRMKALHFREKLDSLPVDTGEILPPVHVRIKPTNACGHNCWYCAYRAENLQLGRDMAMRDHIPAEKMNEIIDDLSEMGVGAVTFSGGGDPFWYPYLLGAVGRLSETAVKFACLTNGSRLEGEIAEIFARKGTWLRVSMDGWDAGSYARYRGVGEAEFGKVMGNMRSFKKMGGKCLLGVSIIVDKQNASHLYELIGQVRDAGADSVKVSHCIVSNNGEENNRYHAPLTATVKDALQRARGDFSGGDFEVFDAYHEMELDFRKGYTWCPYLQILPVIGADLNVYSCQDKAYNVETGLLGSIKEERFKDFWFADKQQFFKIDPSRVCNHHCVADEKNKMVLEYLDADREHLEFV